MIKVRVNGRTKTLRRNLKKGANTINFRVGRKGSFRVVTEIKGQKPVVTRVVA